MNQQEFDILMHIRNEIEWLLKPEHLDDKLRNDYPQIAQLTLKRCLTQLTQIITKHMKNHHPKKKIKIIQLPHIKGKSIAYKEIKPAISLNGKPCEQLIPKDQLKPLGAYRFVYILTFQEKIPVKVANKTVHFKYAKLFSDEKMNPNIIKHGEIDGLRYIAKNYDVNFIVYGFKKIERKKYAYIVIKKKNETPKMIALGNIVCQVCYGDLVKAGMYAHCIKCGLKWIIVYNSNGSFKYMKKVDS